jgi:triacylglycerol lipase
MGTDSASRHLLAPELAPMLEMLPVLDFSHGMGFFRQAFALRERPPVPPELAEVRCEERRIPGAHGAPDVRVLLYTPPGAASVTRPAVLHIHGGGYVLGDPELNDTSNRTYAKDLDCVVVSVDYRLAPETQWPGALEDCFAVLNWLAREAGALGIDPARIAVSGESAGGGHAVALAQHTRDRHGPAIAFLLLDSPMLDDRTGSGHAPHPYCGEFVWTPGQNRYGWGALLGVEPGSDAVPAGAVPARVESLAGLPPAFISVGALDLFLEEDIEFARRLWRAGVACELHVVPGAYHGFFMAAQAPQTRQVERLRREALARALRTAAS